MSIERSLKFQPKPPPAVADAVQLTLEEIGVDPPSLVIASDYFLALPLLVQLTWCKKMLANIDNAQTLMSRPDVVRVMAAELKIARIAEFAKWREDLSNRQRILDSVLLELSPGPDELKEDWNAQQSHSRDRLDQFSPLDRSQLKWSSVMTPVLKKDVPYPAFQTRTSAPDFNVEIFLSTFEDALKENGVIEDSSRISKFLSNLVDGRLPPDVQPLWKKWLVSNHALPISWNEAKKLIRCHFRNPDQKWIEMDVFYSLASYWNPSRLPPSLEEFNQKFNAALDKTEINQNDARLGYDYFRMLYLPFQKVLKNAFENQFFLVRQSQSLIVSAGAVLNTAELDEMGLPSLKQVMESANLHWHAFVMDFRAPTSSVSPTTNVPWSTPDRFQASGNHLPRPFVATPSRLPRSFGGNNTVANSQMKAWAPRVGYTGCFNCGSKEHLSSKCDKPKRVSQKLVAALEEEFHDSHFAAFMLDCLPDAIYAFETGHYCEDYDICKQEASSPHFMQDHYAAMEVNEKPQSKLAEQIFDKGDAVTSTLLRPTLPFGGSEISLESQASALVCSSPTWTKLPWPPPQESQSCSKIISIVAALAGDLDPNQEFVRRILVFSANHYDKAILIDVYFDTGCRRSNTIAESFCVEMGFEFVSSPVKYHVIDGCARTSPGYVDLDCTTDGNNGGVLRFMVLPSDSSRPVRFPVYIGNDMKLFGVSFSIPRTSLDDPVPSTESDNSSIASSSMRPSFFGQLCAVALESLSPAPLGDAYESKGHVYDDGSETVWQKSKRIALTESLKERFIRNNALTESTRSSLNVIDSDLLRAIPIRHDPNLQAKQIYRPQYPLSQFVTERVLEQLEIWEATGKIKKAPPLKPGQRCYNVPLIGALQTRPDGTLEKVRVCGDFSSFNQGLMFQEFPIPDIREIYRRCSGAALFSELDLKEAFLQGMIDPEDQHKLAFTMKGIRYHFIAAPFGLSFLSGLFQMAMEEIFMGVAFVIIFIDNIIIFTPDDYELHFKCLNEVLDICDQRSIRVNMKKSTEKLALRAVDLLGHTMSGKGLSISCDKAVAIQSWEPPKDYKTLNAYLGLLSYLRDFIPSFAAVVAPLYSLGAMGYLKKKPTFVWSALHQERFDLCKQAVASATVLRFPKPGSRLAITSDASLEGLSGCLYIEFSTGDLPSADNIVGFYSRGLRSYEKNYVPYKREFLALVSTIKHFHDYLYGHKFSVHVDAEALSRVMTKTPVSHTHAAWIMDLLAYDFTIYHVSGKDNTLADSLSRIYDSQWSSRSYPSPNPVCISRELFLPFLDNSICIPVPPALERMLNQARAFHHSADHSSPASIPLAMLELNDPLARFESATERPTDYGAIVKDIHAAHGHFGHTAVYTRLRLQGFNWPGMRKDVQRTVDDCEACRLFTGGRVIYPILTSETPIAPLDFVAFDLLTHLSLTPSGNNYALILVDYFTNYTWIRHLKTKKSEEIAAVLFQILGDFGSPVTIQNDMKATLVSDVLAHFYDVLCISRRPIMPHNHRANGKAERAIQTVAGLLKKMQHLTGAHWDAMLPYAQLCMNNLIRTHSRSSPFALMFGREHNLFKRVSNVEYPMGLDEEKGALSIWENHLRGVHEKLFPILHEFMKLDAVKNLVRFHSGHYISERIYPPGTLVMYRDPYRKSKGEPPFVGPYSISSYSPGTGYILVDALGNVKRSGVTLDQLKLQLHASQYLAQDGSSRLEYVDAILEEGLEEGLYRICVVGLIFVYSLPGFVRKISMTQI